MWAVGVEWLVADLGGVCARFRPDRRMTALATATGLAAHDLQTRLFTSGFDHDAEVGVYPADRIVDEVLARLDRRVSADALIEAWSAAYEPNPPVLTLLRAAHVPVCLFTNNGPLLDACLAGPLAALGARFDMVLASWALAARKPDPLAFDRVSARLGARADALLFVDDSPDNVLTAQALGWHAVRYDGDDAVLGSVLAAHGVV